MATAKKKKVKFLKSPAGRFGLSYHVGQVVSMEAKQADECVAAKYAEEVK